MTYSLRIDVYSHNLVVSGASYKCKEALFHFNKRMGQFGKEKVGGQWVWKIIRLFSGFFADRSQFRFHVNQYDDLIDHLARYQIYKRDIFEVTHTPVEGEYYPNMEPLEGNVPREYQIPLIDYFVEEDYKPNNTVLSNLKQPSLIARSKTTTLQTGLGKEAPLDSPIKVPGGWKTMGEMEVGTIVTAADGTPSTVIGVYPQGIKDIYKFTFTDGRVAEAGKEHLWKFKTTSGDWVVDDTAKMMELMDSGEDVYIPLCESEKIESNDPLYGSTVTRVNALKKTIESVGVIDFKELTLDGNGRASMGYLSIKTLSSQQLNRFIYLIRSLGGIAGYCGFNGDAAFGYIPAKPNKPLKVIDIRLSRCVEAQCIAIDHPEHLYVTNDFVVTHNTKSALFAVAKIKRRTVFTMLGGYIPKWVGDIKDFFGYSSKDIIVVQGSKDLRDLIDLAKAGAITEPFIIISNKTFYQFIQHYETSNGDTDLYGCAPHELMTLLNAGLLIKDEVHQDLHLNFRMDLYQHVWKSVNLSATLESDDKFINSIYALQFLKDYRFKGYAYDKYVHIRAMTYNIQNHMIRRVRCQNFSFKSYSHVLFEESIMGNHSLRSGYLLMIAEIIKNEFETIRKDGQKMLIYFATTEFCTLATQYFKEMFPKLTVKRKIQEDPFQNLHTADLIVSTLKSAGTAQDIPGLIRVLMTDSVNSRQINLQALGRLRKLEGTDLFFMYLVCLNIPKQVDYHRHKMEIFADKALSHTERSTGKYLG